MKVVELYGRVRYAVQIEGLSRREAARQFGIDPRTVSKMLAFSVPPGYRRNGFPCRSTASGPWNRGRRLQRDLGGHAQRSRGDYEFPARATRPVMFGGEGGNLASN